jgi:hypothetical protein
MGCLLKGVTLDLDALSKVFVLHLGRKLNSINLMME